MNRVKVALVGCARIAIEVHLPAMLSILWRRDPDGLTHVAVRDGN